jgi:GNAT superfamily N-acetyltransferase
MTIRTAVVPRSEIYELRWTVLRPGRPREDATFPEDADPATFHLAAYDGDAPAVLACITVFPDPLPGSSATAYRFRGMASAPQARGHGYGAAVLRAATAEAAARGAAMLWCNGRTVARGFYESQGFAVVGEEFHVDGIGPHLVFARLVQPPERTQALARPAGGLGCPFMSDDVPQSARIWNYFLGGKDNYEVDRAAGDQVRKMFPGIVDGARAARYYLARAVRHLAGEEGIRQFLDIGTGLPNVDNTHEIAQRVAPESRIVYVDNDPLVLAHARALLTSSPEGLTDYIDADLHQPEAIIESARRILDFTQPVALMLMGILGHIEDFDEARSIVSRLVATLPPGSYLVHYDSTNTSEEYVAAADFYNERATVPYILRSPDQLTRFFDGLDLLDPGVASCSRWRPDALAFGFPAEVHQYGGVARKP